MQNKIKLTIYENEQTVNTFENDICLDPHNLVKSLEDFRRAVNETLTKIIEDDGHFDDYIDEDVNSEEEEAEQHKSPKKRKI